MMAEGIRSKQLSAKQQPGILTSFRWVYLGGVFVVGLSLRALWASQSITHFNGSVSDEKVLEDLVLMEIETSNKPKGSPSHPKRSPASSPFEKAVQQATRLLYKDSPNLNKWLTAPLPTIYIYDTLDKTWSDIDTISNCMDETFGITHSNWTGCNWKTTLCDTKPSSREGRFARYLSYKSNNNAEMGLLQWFLQYPYQTKDPSKADIFFVPFPFKCKCLCNGTVWTGKCSFSMAQMKENVLNKLTYFNSTRKKNHLFLCGADYAQCGSLFYSHKQLKPDFMAVSMGANQYCRNRDRCGHLATPYMSALSKDQPDAVASRSRDWWVHRHRTYALSAIMSTPPSLKMRHNLYQNASSFIPATIGGLPTHVDLQRAGRKIPKGAVDIYQESIFCPILPGDGAVQKRFFDVILAGCIPLVPIWRPSDEPIYPTFFQWSNRPSTKQAYPFHQGTFSGDAKAGIDYLDLVVAFDGFCGLACMTPAAEAILRNSTELERIRSNLHEYSQLFTYGLEKNHFQYMDAFAALSVSMRHHVAALRESSNAVAPSSSLI